MFVLIIVFFMLPQFLHAGLEPIGDNILFAFDRCRSVTADLNKSGALKEENLPAFDMHCVADEKKGTIFKCNFFDASSNRKIFLETLKGGKTELLGNLSNQGGTHIVFHMEKGSAYFDSPTTNASAIIPGRKVCAGIFLLEKDALKRKK